MSTERNRRTLAFRGGGGGNNGNTGCGVGGVGNLETSAWALKQPNGQRAEEEVEVELEDEAEAEVEACGSDRKELQDGGSLSGGSSGDEEEEEEGGGGEGASQGGRRLGDAAEEVDGSGENVKRFGLARPQSLLQNLHCSSFQGSWLQEFPWLQFCQETGLMSCAWCQASGSSGGNNNIGSSGHDELAKGTRNYKRPLLLRHHLSAEHRLNDPAAQEPEIKEELTEVFNDYNAKPNENSYCYQLLQELNDQRKKGILCDVNIVVSGKVFRAHKNILVAGSRFFKTLYCFTNKESRDQTTVTYLDVVAVQGFSVILDFMYSGNLVLTSQNAIEVMSVASYLQMTEVVQACRNFIKDALNISTKLEAPETVVVNYNKRNIINREGVVSEQKSGSFWATRNLTNLASSLKNENDGYSLDEGQTENYQTSDSSWIQDTCPETTEIEPQGQGKVFVWNDVGSHTLSLQEPGKTRRKNQTTKRFIYNIPPNNEVHLESGSMVQPSMPFLEDDLQCFQDGAGTSNEFKYANMFPESWPRESWENGDASSVLMNKLKCPHCNYVAKYRRTLKRHLLIHTGVRSFSCDICGKLFTRREHVKRHSLVHKKDKKYKCMVCKKIFMLAASVGIRHGSRRYGVCVDCVDKSQPGIQEGADQVQDPDFTRDEEYDENDAVEAVDVDEDLVDEGEDQNDQPQWEEQNNQSHWEEQNDQAEWVEHNDQAPWVEHNDQPQWEESGEICMTIDD
ncbi:zinc finger and BTB domain-containing protein 10 [Microcaecilia unicolor]|uniref:Zinc finger and BTB domain-containing protein 10 n=1 Tax=Microcaecilia unicolor TaxID=1415580 RepID=A0A6P7Z544_9AMPH|nr:zinc finger and BTB domain-containing protein 10 [Microcaecilia unicolor]